MGRKLIKGDDVQVGNRYAEHRKGEPTGRVIEIKSIDGDSAKVVTVGAEKSRTTTITLSSIRPKANGWHRVSEKNEGTVDA